MKTKSSFLTIVVFGILFFYFFFSENVCLYSDEPARFIDSEQKNLMDSTASLIKTFYVDEVKKQDLYFYAVRGMLRSLDDYCEFILPDEFVEVEIEAEGKFAGIGVELTKRRGAIVVIAPIYGSPAYFSGLKANDKIVAIDDKDITKSSFNQVVKKIRGKKGTEIKITALRKSEKLFFYIKRDIITIKSLKNIAIIDNKYGYIKIIKFQENTPKELFQVLNSLKDKGVSRIILDLRNNPGGLFSSAVEIADYFLPIGKKIVTSKGRHLSQNMTVYSKTENKYKDIILSILINKGTASAAEILTGALKDSGRALVFGQTSFAKGSIQTVFPIRAFAVRLTTAKYFTPSGRVIDKKGIIPDYIIEEVRGNKELYIENETNIPSYLYSRKIKDKEVKQVLEVLSLIS